MKMKKAIRKGLGIGARLSSSASTVLQRAARDFDDSGDLSAEDIRRLAKMLRERFDEQLETHETELRTYIAREIKAAEKKSPFATRREMAALKARLDRMEKSGKKKARKR